jgi:hypothetical protein
LPFLPALPRICRLWLLAVSMHQMLYRSQHSRTNEVTAHAGTVKDNPSSRHCECQPSGWSWATEELNPQLMPAAREHVATHTLRTP